MFWGRNHNKSYHHLITILEFVTTMSEPPTKKLPGEGKPAKKDLTAEEKKKLKEERRALQEAQRAAKATASSGKGGGAGEKKGSGQQIQVPQRQPSQQKPNKVLPRTEAQKKVPLFLHLKQYEREGSLTKKVGFSEADAKKVHPAILTLGLRYAEGVIRGADARCVAMLQAFSEVIRDFVVPQGDSFPRALTKHLNPQFDFLTTCRTHAVTMGNAFVHLKHAISKIPPEMSESRAKQEIIGTMEDFVKTNVVMAVHEIVKAGEKLIVDGDVILTFARSSVVEQVLLYAHSQGKNFEVVVIAARPHHEALQLLNKLVAAKIRCRYGQLASISYLLQDCSKVFLGAGALFSNGAVLARAGTAMVAMMARTQRKPVLVFSESYKFSERVQLDSVVFNELGDPEELIMSDQSPTRDSSLRDPLCDWRDTPTLKLLNLSYDITLGEFVDVIVTETGNLPPSSVPVILRERKDYQKE